MGFEAKIIADSISRAGVRIITMQLKYPRFIHAEFMTHRVFSRNASSSRAIPVAKMIEQVRTDPAMPIHWGANQPGMQAHAECANAISVPPELWHPWRLFWGEWSEHPVSELATSNEWWRFLGWLQSYGAEAFMAAGYHKQVVNRRLEADQWISVIVTATEWANFFELRNHEDAQPEIRYLAQLMLEAQAKSAPQLLERDDWHLPYITVEERWSMSFDHLRKISAARCARVSYLTHDGKTPSVEADLALYERLVGSTPLHASPVEHQATPDMYANTFGEWLCPDGHGNFVGWLQNRKILEVAPYN